MDHSTRKLIALDGDELEARLGWPTYRAMVQKELYNDKVKELKLAGKIPHHAKIEVDQKTSETDNVKEKIKEKKDKKKDK